MALGGVQPCKFPTRPVARYARGHDTLSLSPPASQESILFSPFYFEHRTLFHPFQACSTCDERSASEVAFGLRA